MFLRRYTIAGSLIGKLRDHSLVTCTYWRGQTHILQQKVDLYCLYQSREANFYSSLHALLINREVEGVMTRELALDEKSPAHSFGLSVR